MTSCGGSGHHAGHGHGCGAGSGVRDRDRDRDVEDDADKASETESIGAGSAGKFNRLNNVFCVCGCVSVLCSITCFVFKR